MNPQPREEDPEVVRGRTRLIEFVLNGGAIGNSGIINFVNTMPSAGYRVFDRYCGKLSADEFKFVVECVYPFAERGQTWGFDSHLVAAIDAAQSSAHAAVALGIAANTSDTSVVNAAIGGPAIWASVDENGDHVPFTFEENHLQTGNLIGHALKVNPLEDEHMLWLGRNWERFVPHWQTLTAQPSLTCDQIEEIIVFLESGGSANLADGVL